MAHDNNKHAELKALYAEDEKWMAEPWTAWQWKLKEEPDSFYMTTIANGPSWRKDCDYRRRPDAPGRCCTLCKHRESISCKLAKNGLVAVVFENGQFKRDFCPDWCPLEAKPERCCRLCKYESKTDGVVCDHELWNESRSWCPLDAEAKQETCDKCSTCRHDYEEKPRTIQISAELPEPKDISYEEFRCNPCGEPALNIVIVFNDKSDAKAWLKMWREQVAK